MKLFDYLKTILDKEKCEYLYVNHTNEFFSEYVDVLKSSRYLLTKFTGSMGDAVVSKDKIYLMVDSRYWEQAEIETDKNIVEVVKLGAGKPFEELFKTLVNPGSKIMFYDKKTSFSLLEKFEKMGYKIKITSHDYVAKYENITPKKLKTDFIKIPNSITGRSAQQKIKKLQNKLCENEVLLVTSLEDVSYLLNLKSDVFEYSSVVWGKIIITKNDYKFFTDEKLFEKEVKTLSARNVKFLIDKNSLSVKYKKYFKSYEQAKCLSTLRSVKNYSELKHMQSCFERTDMVLSAVYNSIKKKDFTEEELFNLVNEKFKEYGAEKNSFKTILASGKNSSIVHFSHPTKRKIENGDFVLLDCGGFYEGGYATDITRTFIKGQSPSKLQKTIYTVVLKAFLNAYNVNLSEKKTCFEIDKLARDMISDLIQKYNLQGFTFGHGLGHSVGRCVHDGLPTISPSVMAKMKVKKNMVFTVEPGLYKPDFGGVRLENTVHVVKENEKLKLKSFSKAPFQECLIDFSMLNKTEKEYLKEWELV